MRFLLLLAFVSVLAACGSDSDYAGEMREQHDGETPDPSGATAGATDLDVVTEEVEYATVDGQAATGILARPAEADGPLPAVIVIHEWWGLNDNIRDMARRIANEGYLALAVDLYGGEVADTPDAAQSLMQAAMGQEDALTDNLRQAYAYLAEREQAPAVGSVGWCFGGMWSLRTALALPSDLDAAVIYYGRPVTEADQLAALEVPVLGLFGEADGSIPMFTVREFETALTEAGVENEIVSYEGAAHAFANPSGQRYDAAAAEDAWTRTTAFFAEHLTAAPDSE
ncbi:MAG: dienelactone hydrolase family protein [Bacteroidota bacterium]